MNINSIHRAASVAFTSVVCLFGIAQASDHPSAEAHSVTVNYRDLDLSTIEGANLLYQRLKAAARQVCDGPANGLEDYREWRSCYDAAIADAVATVNSPLLTALHHGPNKVTTVTAMLGK